MSTLRELASESIGRITRRGLEPQIAQIEGALLSNETAVAVAPGKDGAAGVVVVVTDSRLLLSSGAPFSKPVLEIHALADITAADAIAIDDAWALVVDHDGGRTSVAGMFDRDAVRLVALLVPGATGPQPTSAS